MGHTAVLVAVTSTVLHIYRLVARSGDPQAHDLAVKGPLGDAGMRVAACDLR